MKRLDRYIARDLVLPFLAGTVVLAVLFTLNELIRILQEQISTVPATAILQLAVLALPHWLLMCLPAGMAFSVGLVMSRVIRESELTALRAAGVTIRRVIRPALIWSVVMAAFCYYLVEKVVPYANQRHDTIQAEFFAVAGKGDFLNDVPIMIDRYMIKPRQVIRNRDRSLTMNDVLLYERVNDSEYSVYRSDSGTYKDGVFTLKGNRIVWNSEDSHVLIASDLMTINHKIDVPEFFPPMSGEGKSISQLWLEFRNQNADLPEARTVQATLLQDILNPVMCVVFALMGGYSAVRFAKHGAFVGVTIASAWPVLYFSIELIGLTLSKGGQLPVVPAMLAGFVLCILITGLMAWKVE